MTRTSSTLHPSAAAAILVLSLLACSTFDRTQTGPTDPAASSASVLSASTHTVAWFAEPGGVAVAADAADNTYAARWDYNPAGDIYVAKRNVSGALLWEVRYDNTDNTRHEVASWVETDGGGNVFVSGTIRSGYSNPVNVNGLLMKFSPSGQLLWRKVFASPFDGSSTRKVLVDGADNAYVFGLGTSPNGQRMMIRKFAPNGTLLWVWFDPAGIGGPLNIKWSNDGALLVSGRGIFGSLNGFAKVDQNGSSVWSIAPIQSLSIGDVAGDATGNSYLINGNYGGTGSLLRKVGPTGATIWEKPHPMAGQRVEVGRDNLPVVGGYAPVGYGAAFAKFDASGNLTWTNLDADGPSVNLLAIGQMRLDAADNPYIAASTMSQMGVAKVLGTTGVADWTALIPYGYAVSMDFGQGGRVFVTGGTTALITQSGSPPPPPTNTAPAVTIAANAGLVIPKGGTFSVTGLFSDPDAGDGPWTYKWRWSTGSTSGVWTAPGSYAASRVYPRSGTYSVSLLVTDARGAVGTSNTILVTVR